MTTDNQRITLRLLAERLSDLATAQTAIHAIDLAFKATRDGTQATSARTTKFCAEASSDQITPQSKHQ